MNFKPNLSVITSAVIAGVIVAVIAANFDFKTFSKKQIQA